MENQIIVIKQLPKIEQHFNDLGSQIRKKTETAKALVCTEESRKEIKKVRSELNKESSELKQKFKTVETEILEPWQKIKKLYREQILIPYSEADVELKAKIYDVENTLKDEKGNAVKSFFVEYKAINHVEWLTWKQANIKVRLSDSEKSLKQQAKSFVERVVQDVAFIDTLDNSANVLVEYKANGLDSQRATLTVNNRIEAAEREKQRIEETKAIHQQELEAAKKVEKVVLQKPTTIPIEKPIEKPIQKLAEYSAAFEVIGTIEQLKALKDFLISSNIKFKC